MATTHDITVKASIFSSLGNIGDLDSGASVIAKAYLKHLLTGTGTDQSNWVWSDTGSATGAATSLDLYGVLLNKFGETINGAKLKGILLITPSTNSTNLELVMPASGVPFMLAATDAMLLPPDTCVLWSSSGAGITITATTGDLVNLHATSGTCAYDIVLWGTA